MPTDEPELSYIAYDLFLADVEAVARQLEQGGWRPDFLVGIGRGGLVPAAFLSHRLDIAMLSVDISSGEPGFAGELLDKLGAKLRAGQRLLIVDDINDSGTTIFSLRAALEAQGADDEHLKVAVMIDNASSRARAEYWSRRIDRRADKRWFVFPWEAVAPRAALIEESREVPERLS
ncbi:MAG: phosphoribosyltransferase [Allosphingosinicella sp.]